MLHNHLPNHPISATRSIPRTGVSSTHYTKPLPPAYEKTDCPILSKTIAAGVIRPRDIVDPSIHTFIRELLTPIQSSFLILKCTSRSSPLPVRRIDVAGPERLSNEALRTRRQTHPSVSLDPFWHHAREAI